LKRTKRVCLLLLALFLCLPLCSCKELDDMRDRQVFIQEDGTLLWKGQIYKKLPNVNNTNLLKNPREFMQPRDDFGSLRVTYPDLPVLLSRRFDEAMGYSIGNGDVIYVYNTSALDIGGHYCLPEYYDEIVQVIEKIVPLSKYYFESYDTDTGNMVPCFLTDEQEEAVKHVLRTGEIMDESNVSTNYGFALYVCDYYEWIRQYVVDVHYSEEEYYLINTSSNGDFKHIRVPEEYKSLFEDMAQTTQENSLVYTE